MSSTAFITGITGQDGAYLAKLLLEKGYEVVGGARWSAQSNLLRLKELGIADAVEIVDIDLVEITNLINCIERIRPSEIYNLAAQSFVGLSFDQPLYVSECNALGVTRILEAIRRTDPSIRFYQASTSEMFGKVVATPQNEQTPFYPRSPYGVAKTYGHWITVNYRESFDLHACSGILFNHESPLRGQQFVTRKITLGLAEIKHGRRDCLELGNLDARRDWGFAGDYVAGMWRMLQAERADDYVLASGENHRVRDFLGAAAACLGFDLEFEGSGVDEVAIDRRTGRRIVRISRDFFRPAEVDLLLGDARKAEEQLGWQRQVSFEALVQMMAESDERRVRDNQLYL